MAEWDVSKRQGWVIADGEGGLAGLGQAWSGAKLWPDSGQVKLHLSSRKSTGSGQGFGIAVLGQYALGWGCSDPLAS